MRLLIAFLLSLSVFSSNARIFTRCKLAKELNDLNMFSMSLLGSWVCLIEKVSNRNTNAYTERSGGRKFYGLYQIPNKWCKVGKPGGDCNVACELLLDDDIRDDTACAVKIFNQEGFKYWSLWNTRCQSQDINHITTEIYKCPELMGISGSPERDVVNDNSVRGRKLY